ncbi:MAG: LPXTG cell wall anchor domain-containing protein [Methanobacteriota archaeon]|nr:MAG: LPXTG cell wall anchor domain-containing protein [Euryarchaeota archaeon]
MELWPLYLLLVAPLVMIGTLVWYSRRKKRWSY